MPIASYNSSKCFESNEISDWNGNPSTIYTAMNTISEYFQ